MKLNIYLKELGNYKKSVLFWFLGVVGLLASGMSKYQGYAASEGSITEIMNSLPAGFSALFGVGTLDLETAGGFFAILALYLSVMLGVHAVLLGSGIIAKEETDKTAEFLFVKPISRARVLTSKVLAALTIIVMLHIATAITSLLVVGAFNEGPSISSDILLLMPGIFFIQLLFLTIGTAFASIIRQPKRAGQLSAAVLLATFIISAFIDLTARFNFLKYLTPFKYFDIKSIFIDSSYDISFVVITFVVVSALLAASYIFYKKRDLQI
jgi:ABC-2 type transport system permease protein